MSKLVLLAIFVQGCLSAVVKERAQCADFCPEYYKPVCGSDGKTYSNDCFFQSAQCHDNTLSMSHMGLCGSIQTHIEACPMMACIALYDPVCGTDGKTYSNACQLHTTHCHGDVTVAHTGDCGGDLLLS